MGEPFYRHKDRSELRELLRKSSFERLAIEDEAFAAGPVERTTATVIDWVSLQEDTFILYSFVAIDPTYYARVEHLFGYLTPFDETHRGWGNHSPEWYDVLGAGFQFEVEYLADSPPNHRAVTPELTGLNGSVALLGQH